MRAESYPQALTLFLNGIFAFRGGLSTARKTFGLNTNFRYLTPPQRAPWSLRHRPVGSHAKQTSIFYFESRRRWPSAEEVAGDLTEDQRASILAAVSASDYKKSPKAKNWVGGAVAYAVGLDLDDTVQRKRAASLVTALVREGALVEREERDPVRRELAVFVRAA